MATTGPIAVTSAWTVLAGSAGAKKFNLSNNGGTAIEYDVAASAPASTVFGVELRPGRMVPVDVPSGQSIYVRTINGTTGNAAGGGVVHFDDVT